MHAQNLLASVPGVLQDSFDLVLVLFVFVVFLGSNKISGMLPEYQRSVQAGYCNPKLKSSLQELLGSGDRRSAWKPSDPPEPLI